MEEDTLTLRLKLRHRLVRMSSIPNGHFIKFEKWRGERHAILVAVDKFTTGRCCVLTEYVTFEDEQDAIMFRLGY